MSKTLKGLTLSLFYIQPLSEASQGHITGFSLVSGPCWQRSYYQWTAWALALATSQCFGCYGSDYGFSVHLHIPLEACKTGGLHWHASSGNTRLPKSGPTRTGERNTDRGADQYICGLCAKGRVQCSSFNHTSVQPSSTPILSSTLLGLAAFREISGFLFSLRGHPIRSHLGCWCQQTLGGIDRSRDPGGTPTSESRNMRNLTGRSC